MSRSGMGHQRTAAAGRGRARSPRRRGSRRRTPPAVNSITRSRARSPVARYSAGAIVVGLSESASPIEMTRPIRRSMARILPGATIRRPLPGERSRAAAQAKCSSSPSSSATGRSHVGHHHRASIGVPHTAWRGARRALGVARAPAGQQPQRAGELLAGRAQLVDEPRRALGVRARDDQRVALELAQALGEHVGRDARDLLLQLAEPARAVEQRGDQQQRPAVADRGQRVGERARGGRSPAASIAIGSGCGATVVG